MRIVAIIWMVITLIGAIIPDFHPWQHYVDVTSAFICGCVFMFLIMSKQP